MKYSQNYLFNSKKFFKKDKEISKINESDIILKNEELKEEFLKENNLILESSKGNEFFERNKFSINENFEEEKIEPSIEMRRMLIELIK